MQASTVKDLPDMERLKSAKFTGLRWDIDPVVIEYFRYLLKDVVGTNGRRTSTSHQRQRSSSSSSSSNSRAVKSTSAMLMSDRRLSVGSSLTSAGNTEARRCSMFRQFSQQQQQQQQPSCDTTSSPSNRALARWRKV